MDKTNFKHDQHEYRKQFEKLIKLNCNSVSVKKDLVKLFDKMEKEINEMNKDDKNV